MARKKKTDKDEGGGFARMLAGTVILGIVFSAGLITGQRLLRADARAPMVSLSVSRPAQQPGAAAAQPSLRTTFSFYEHLTATAPAEAAAPPAPPAPTEPPPAPQAEAQKPTPAAPKPADAAKPIAPIAPPAAGDAPARPADPELDALLDDVVDSLAGEQKPAPASALPARYTLQVSSHPDRESAEREMGRLTAMGVEPHVLAVEVPGKGKIWRIRVGKFHTMDEARDHQGALKARRGIAGFVTPL